MAYALVGSEGTVVDGGTSATAVTPAYGAGQTRTAGNLLILWVLGYNTGFTVAFPTTPAGWTMAQQVNDGGVSTNSTIFYKVATGADAAPLVAANTNSTWVAKVGEFSGGATSTPADQGSTAGGTATPLVATNAGADVASGELVIACGGVGYTTAATRTLTHTIANCSGTDDTNNAASVTRHYALRWGTMSTNAAADSDSFAIITMNMVTGGALTMQSFKLAGGAPAAGIPNLTMAPLSH